MMKVTPTLYARAGATAIAAVLALSSIQLHAQEVPSAPEPPPAITSTPAPTLAPDSTPVTTDTATPATDPAPASTIANPPTKRTASARKPAKVNPPGRRPRHEPRDGSVSRGESGGAHCAGRASCPCGRPAGGQADRQRYGQASQRTVRPDQAEAGRRQSERDRDRNWRRGAALLALGGGAYALMRRRRREEEMTEEFYQPVEEPAAAAAATELGTIASHDPAVPEEQSAMVAPSAFAWGNAEPAAQPSSDDDGSDRLPGETWIERAYRGPSPNNPSVSLRARLKRAAFFDKREREVAAGSAQVSRGRRGSAGDDGGASGS